jgi:hypothetical protein
MDATDVNKPEGVSSSKRCEVGNLSLARLMVQRSRAGRRARTAAPAALPEPVWQQRRLRKQETQEDQSEQDRKRTETIHDEGRNPGNRQHRNIELPIRGTLRRERRGGGETPFEPKRNETVGGRR